MRQQAHVVGNGPSNIQFNPEEHLQSDIFYCNFGPNPTVYDCFDSRFHFVIADKKPIHQMNLGEMSVTRNKVILSDRANKFYTEFKLDLNVFAVVPNTKIDSISKHLWMNSGHLAAMYCIQNGYKKITLWGIDSLKSNSLISATNGYKLRESEQIARVWRWYWEYIFNLDKSVSINR